MSPSDRDNDDPDEPRVKDLDPETIAQLASWFELPSFASLEDAPPPPPAETEAQQVQAHRREVLAQIDPAMVDLVERHRRDATRLQRVHAPERPWDAGRRITVFDDRAVPPPFDPYDAPEVDIPAALKRELKINTPQAFLRDLYRPEKEFWVQLRSPWEDDGDTEPAAGDAMAPVRALIRQSYRPPDVPRATLAIAASTADYKGLLARPWQESKRERARAREAELLGKLDGGGAVSREPEGAP